MTYQLSKKQAANIEKSLPEILHGVKQFFEQDPGLQSVEVSRGNETTVIVYRTMFPELDEKLLGSFLTGSDARLLIGLLDNGTLRHKLSSLVESGLACCNYPFGRRDVDRWRRYPN